MEKKIKRMPFSIELAKKVISGEVNGCIHPLNGGWAKILSFDSCLHFVYGEHGEMITKENKGYNKPIVAEYCYEDGTPDIVSLFPNGKYADDGISDVDLVIDVYEEEPKKKKLIIAIDFDGVIAEINKNWVPGTPNIPGNLVKDADTYIRKLHEDGHDIIIWTCRRGYNLYLAEQFIEEHNIPYDRINDNVESFYDHFKHNTRKVHADIYIDDHQIGDLPSWKEIYEIIKKKSEE